jgi:hypothetical protein
MKREKVSLTQAWWGPKRAIGAQCNKKCKEPKATEVETLQSGLFLQKLKNRLFNVGGIR